MAEQLGADSPCMAALLRAGDIARAIVEGKMAPYEGAHAVAGDAMVTCHDYLNEGIDAMDNVGAFGALADDYEEAMGKPEELRQIDSQLLEVARDLLQLLEADFGHGMGRISP